MEKQDQQRLIGDTLALVNVVREAFGVAPLTDLPDAAPGHAADCLFARALAEVGVKSVGGSGHMDFADARSAQRVAALWGTQVHGHGTVVAPEQFGRLIAEFDNRQLKQYNDDGS